VISRIAVYGVIDGERDYQDNLGFDRAEFSTGGDGSITHTVGDFVTMLQHYQSELVRSWTTEPGNDKALDIVRKIAAISVNCMEQHGALPRGYLREAS